VPQGLVVRFGLGLDALCKIKSNQKIQQLSGGSCCRDLCAAGLVSSLFRPSNFSDIMQPTHTARDEHSTAVHTSSASTASRFSRQPRAVDAHACRGFGEAPWQLCHTHSRLIMALGSRPSAPAGRCREAAAQQPRCGGAALAAAAILAAAARPSHQLIRPTAFFVLGMLPS